MEMYRGVVFEKFIESDVEILAPIMQRTFEEEAKTYFNTLREVSLEYDSINFLREYALHKESQAFKISKDGQPIGGIILWISDSNINYLGNIFIDIEYQNKGIGLTIWRFIESKYLNTKVWKTEAPSFSRRNYNFYVNKCGFKMVKIDRSIDERYGFYHLEKVIQ